MNDSNLDAVVFDLYGTLVDYGSLAQRFARSVADPDAFVAAWRTKQLAYAMAATLMERYLDFDELTARAYRYVATLHRAPLRAEDVAAASAAWSSLPPFPDAGATLATLHAAGLTTAVLSNGTPSALAATLANADLARSLDVVMSVDAVHRFKPHPSVYALAETELGVPRARIAFVSSNGWDATGAAEFGMRVVWCNRGNLPAETFGTAPARTIASLSDLPDALRAL